MVPLKYAVKRLIIALPLCSVAVTTEPLTAQRGQSVLELLETRDRNLRIGDRETETLSDADYRSINDTYLEAWALEGPAGSRVTIDMQSEDFDPYLFVIGPGLPRALQDDASGDGCSARITFTLLQSGTYRVVASNRAVEQTGSYTIAVVEGSAPPPRYACGEMDPTFLSDLPTDGRRLEMGTVASGELTTNGPMREGNIPVEAWLLVGRAGRSVMITLESTDFDAMLFVTGQGLDSVLSDDDGAGSLNSRLTVQFPADGDYIVAASALTEGSTGSYTLTVAEPVDFTTLTSAGRLEMFGEAVTGFLSEDDPVVMDGRRGQAWELEGVAGESVTIELRSDEFDTFLYLVGPGLDQPLSDDDSAGDLNSRISFTFIESGTYRVIVSGLSAANTGSFELSVVR
jgi:hypothetical protein